MKVKAKCIRLVEDSSLLGVFTVIFDDILEVNDFKLVKGKNGKSSFVSVPSEAYKSGKETKYHNIVWITDDDLKESIEKAIKKAYKKAQEDSDE